MTAAEPASRAAASSRAVWEATQRGLWGQRPRDWASLAEPQNLALVDAALAGCGVGTGTTLLDVGCGSGLALQRAAARGARCAGVDVAAPLLAIARERVPDADLHEHGLDALPFAGDRFDAVLAVNALQFAWDPAAAIAEITRVLRTTGVVAVAQFSAPERCESTALHLAMEALVPPTAHADHAPYALSVPGALQRALVAAGMVVDDDRELAVDWIYADLERALAGVICSGGGTRAVRAAGEDTVRVALSAAIAPFARDDGSYRMRNHFRLLVAHPDAERGPVR